MDASASEGETLFRKNCQTCHTLAADEPRRQGPPLHGIVGRIAGTVDGFPYSQGLKQADWAWTSAKLDAWLADPKGMFADTYMIYKQDDPQVRQKIISFLETIGN